MHIEHHDHHAGAEALGAESHICQTLPLQHDMHHLVLAE